MSNSEAIWPWSELGLEGKPSDPKDVRRAYAKKLKAIDAETDVMAFETLRNAYDQARRMVGTAKKHRSVTPQNATQITEQAPLQPQLRPSRMEQHTKSEPPVRESDGVGLENPWAKPDFSDPQVVLSVAQELASTGNSAAQDWIPLIEAPALSDPYVSHNFQWILQDFMQNQPVLRMPSNERVDLFVAIDDRFGWVSDGLGFIRRFPNARLLQMKMADELRKEEWRLKRNKVTFSTKGEDAVKSVPISIWLITIFIWLILASLGDGNVLHN